MSTEVLDRCDPNYAGGCYILRVEDRGSVLAYTCLGFDNAYETAYKVAAFYGFVPPDPANKGTEQGYEDYERVMRSGRMTYAVTRRRCPALLNHQLRGLEGKRVEVVDRGGETRRFWVGRSDGWLPIHLEIERKSDRGGCSADTEYRSVEVVRKR